MKITGGCCRRRLGWLAVLLLSCLVGRAEVAEPSDSLKEVYKSGDAHFFTFNYPSKDADGEDVVLSSLLVAWITSKPERDSIESLHIYCHYTITSDRECPTSDDNSTDRNLFSWLVKGRYGPLGLNSSYNFISRSVLIAPDYEGYGVSRARSHPYLSQRLTARQVADGVAYGLMLYRKHVNDKRASAFKRDWRSFCVGFSQGGAVALAVQRHIEENGMAEALHFRGCLCADGPYDLISTIRYYLEDNGESYDTKTDHRRGMIALPMVIPMIIKGMLDTHPDMKAHKLEDYLSQQFLDTGIMDWLASKEYTTTDISRLWYGQLQYGLDADVRHYSPAQMAELFHSPAKDVVWARLDRLFTPGFYAYISDEGNLGAVPTARGDAWQDLHRAMAENSVVDGWTPMNRIQFVHSRGDMVVPFGNYLAFRDAHPDDEGTLYRLDDSITSSDHGTVGTWFFGYLCLSGSYGEFFQWLDESPGTTDIPSLAGAEREAVWHDLSGRRLPGRPSAKGIYICGGRKIAVE